jgi:hypothetical protein
MLLVLGRFVQNPWCLPKVPWLPLRATRKEYVITVAETILQLCRRWGGGGLTSTPADLNPYGRGVRVNTVKRKNEDSFVDREFCACLCPVTEI